MDDWRLLETYAETGDSDAFAALVERHLGLVYATALRITGDRGAAEDVSQATFVLLEEKVDLLMPVGSLASWLYQSAAIISRHLQRMSLKDAGIALGISEDAAGKRVARAAARLRDWFERRGIRCTSDLLGGAMGRFALVVPPPQLGEQIMNSALGVSVGVGAAHTVGEGMSNWLTSRSAMAMVFLMAAASPVMVSLISSDRKVVSPVSDASEMVERVSSSNQAPLTPDEAEWIAIWKNHAPPKGSFGELMSAIAKVQDPLKQDVFKAVAYSEWVEKGLPVPANLEFVLAVPLFEQMLEVDPVRAGELAESFNQGNDMPRYLGISSKLKSLAGKNPRALASFIKLVDIPTDLRREYGGGSWQFGPTSLPPRSGDERSADIRDAVALLSERDPVLAESTVEDLQGWHREQALAGLIMGRF